MRTRGRGDSLRLRMAELPDLALLERLREVLDDQPVTETELRTLSEQADGLLRTLRAHIAGNQRPLEELTDEPERLLRGIVLQLIPGGALRSSLRRDAPFQPAR